MSTLFSRIQTDSMQALKQRESAKVQTLRMIISQLKYKQIELKGECTDEMVVSAIRKQLKELTEANAQFAAAHRADLIVENQAQIEVLQVYLPAEIADAALQGLIADFIATNQAAYDVNPTTLTGKVVGALRAHAAPDRIAKMYGSMKR